ncbi:MAG: glyoxylate/hydroxypyruvate reductase A [Actinomycetota bacterium]
MSEHGTAIPFVSRLTAVDAERWMNALAHAMPHRRIVPLDGLTDRERQDVEVAIVVNPDPADLSDLPSLRWVQSLWAGVEQLASEPPGEGITIVRLEDPQMSETMAEAVLSWVLYLHRDMPRYRTQQDRGSWRPLEVRLASDTTIGILGMGNMGRASAARLLQQDFTVLGWSRTPGRANGVEMFTGPEGLIDLLTRSSIVVVLLPLTAETHGLLDDDHLSLMPHGSSIINFARGPIVHGNALIARLDSGALSHAVLDVFDVEPLPAGSSLWAHPDVTVLPHIAAPTNLMTASAVVARNISHFEESGEVPAGIDLQRGY